MSEAVRLLEEAPALRAALAPHAGTLCDACLGRTLARAGDQTGNTSRGREMRAFLQAPMPDVCALCEGLTGRMDHWVQLCKQAAQEYEFDSFLVGCVTFAHIRRHEESLFEQLAHAGADVGKRFEARPTSPAWPAAEWLKTEINREVGRGLEALLGKRVDFDRPELTFRLDTRFDHVGLQVADLFVKGRYRKFVRDLPQTRWPCRACGGIGCRQCGGTGKTYEASVEELVAAPFVEAAQAEEEAFHGMGREDIDARTLGSGRPFVLELKRPRRRRLDWHVLQGAVNTRAAGRVEVEGVMSAQPHEAAAYKSADPAKSYEAACVSATMVDRATIEAALRDLAGVQLEQRTPQRVSHRRADLVRRRRIHLLRLLSWSQDGFRIAVRADSGTYIKEFVSGDEGRTQPSLSQRLGVACRVVELDVVEIHWPEAAGAGPTSNNP